MIDHHQYQGTKKDHATMSLDSLHNIRDTKPDFDKHIERAQDDPDDELVETLELDLKNLRTENDELLAAFREATTHVTRRTDEDLRDRFNQIAEEQQRRAAIRQKELEDLALVGHAVLIGAGKVVWPLRPASPSPSCEPRQGDEPRAQFEYELSTGHGYFEFNPNERFDLSDGQRNAIGCAIEERRAEIAVENGEVAAT